MPARTVGTLWMARHWSRIHKERKRGFAEYSLVKTKEYLSFLLRLWRVKQNSENGWRASLEYPQTGRAASRNSLGEVQLTLIIRQRSANGFISINIDRLFSLKTVPSLMPSKSMVLSLIVRSNCDITLVHPRLPRNWIDAHNAPVRFSRPRRTSIQE